tara:strand:- start:233 stop:541 length:309 start_codon:yes stop_codon:yes gene_type:complete
MLVTTHETHIVPACIKIRNNVTLPPVYRPVMNKYGFIALLEEGQSFEINGDTPEFKPKSLGPAAYQVAKYVRRTTNKKFRVACRTIEGTSTHPTKTACWRVA